MAKITNLSRRGAVYWWRRRTRCDGVVIALAVSLRTKELRVARERAARLGDVFERLHREVGGDGVVVDSAVVNLRPEHQIGPINKKVPTI